MTLVSPQEKNGWDRTFQEKVTVVLNYRILICYCQLTQRTKQKKNTQATQKHTVSATLPVYRVRYEAKFSAHQIALLISLFYLHLLNISPTSLLNEVLDRAFSLKI